MAEKFLILGGTSFYGSSFAKLVAEKGDYAFPVGRKEFNLNKFVGGRPELLDFRGFHYIVNFISKSLVEESWKHPMFWFQTNASATVGLIDHLRKFDFRRFVHVSTPEVYGSSDAWVTESQPFNPSTPYAVSRAAADMALAAWHKAYGFKYIITRTANIYGATQPEHRLIPLAVKTFKAGKKLNLHGGGATLRGWIHVKDACEATYLLCKRGEVGETYHIATMVVYSVREVAERLQMMIGQGSIGEQKDRLGKDLSYKLNTDKIRALGWEDKIPLDEGLRECI